MCANSPSSQDESLLHDETLRKPKKKSLRMMKNLPKSLGDKRKSLRRRRKKNHNFPN
jgi:hypothetical protein